MEIGMIGLGRMGAGMVERLLSKGHSCVVFDNDGAAADRLVAKGARKAESLADLAAKLKGPRAVWLMVPSAIVDGVVEKLTVHLKSGDVLVDGGNSHFPDDLKRGKALREKGIHYVDVGTSGGVWGSQRGYCLMVGGEPEAVALLAPAFDALAPGPDAAPRTEARAGGPLAQEEKGWLHCGPHGAGHFVKMVHNGIEYGLMAAYAEGFALLERAGIGSHKAGEADAETSPLRNSEHYRYDFDVAAISEVWRRGSVIASWLLDLSASALKKSPQLEEFQGQVSDSGEGRWTLETAIEIGVPTPVLASALFQRFQSRGEGAFANKMLSAMRKEFGGHVEKGTKK
jgi:6-phosphogluconate dehydrogenase